VRTDECLFVLPLDVVLGEAPAAGPRGREAPVARPAVFAVQPHGVEPEFTTTVGLYVLSRSPSATLPSCSFAGSSFAVCEDNMR